MCIRDSIKSKIRKCEVDVMREQKYHVYLTAEEQSRVIQSLIRLKNELLEQGKYTDAVDDVLCKVLSAKKKRKFSSNYILPRI